MNQKTPIELALIDIGSMASDENFSDEHIGRAVRNNQAEISDALDLLQDAEQLRVALKAAPLRKKNESGEDFDNRQTAWLRDFRNKALSQYGGGE